MLEKIASIEVRYAELTRLMDENMQDYQKVVELAKERSELETIISIGTKYRSLLSQYEQAKELAASDDEEMSHLAALEIEELPVQIEEVEKQIKL